MKEVGMINGHIDSALNRQGHMDLMMVVDAGFPCPDHVELIDIALAVPERSGAARTVTRTPFVEAVGKKTQAAFAAGGEIVTFVGEALIAVGNWLRGRAQYRRSDLFLIIQLD